MISIVTYGRNDNYGYNLYKRSALGFNCLAEILADKGDEIFFVDYNTPGHLPTLPEYIWDTLTERAQRRLKVIRISSKIHEQIKGDSKLPILENVSRNAAIVRSNPANRWILSTNPDVILLLAPKWKNLDDVLAGKPDTFYELPRFDIPESVWSGLPRMEANHNMLWLRKWLTTNRAAVVETTPDFRFQPFFLFDAPGDFQLAPREFFLRVRGFDETMNQYFHSDSNLAKRMWLLNGKRCDHLLDDVWALHQDHYLSGEWTARNVKAKHNDYRVKVLEQSEIEAPNPEGWGLKGVELPLFNLWERFQARSVSYPPVRLPEDKQEVAAQSNGNLGLSREIDWSLQPLYRLCHYHPEVVTLYLRELLQVVPPETRIVYLGENRETLERVQRFWQEIAPQGRPVVEARKIEAEDKTPADMLLVDCYYQRSEESSRKVTLMKERLSSHVAAGRMSQAEANEELMRYVDNADAQNLAKQLGPLWSQHLPSIQMMAGAYVVLIGCNPYMGAYQDFQMAYGKYCSSSLAHPSVLQNMHAFYQRLKVHLGSEGRGGSEAKKNGLLMLVAPLLAVRLWKRAAFRKLMGHPSIMGMIYVHHVQARIRRLSRTLKLETLYTHHRLVVLRTAGQQEALPAPATKPASETAVAS